MGTTNIILLGAIVGGMMSIDMGGPFNKAAYVFGTGALTAGTTSGQLVMASVMVGGMVPPWPSHSPRPSSRTSGPRPTATPAS